MCAIKFPVTTKITTGELKKNVCSIKIKEIRETIWNGRAWKKVSLMDENFLMRKTLNVVVASFGVEFGQSEGSIFPYPEDAAQSPEKESSIKYKRKFLWKMFNNYLSKNNLSSYVILL